ncbi:MAG: hypothetical protein WD426_11005 [Anditalea sp.]
MDKREEMVLLIEGFLKSGQSQKDFSASKGMAFHTFNYWYRKLKKKTDVGRFCAGGYPQVRSHCGTGVGSGLPQRGQAESTGH